jgi:hypothetical protein
MKRINVFGAVLCLALTTHAAGAQQAAELEKGVRVRVTVSNGDQLVGSLISGVGDSLRVMTDGSGRKVRSTLASNVRTIEVSRGQNRPKGALIDALIGLGIGATSGALLGAATYSDPDQTSCFMVCSKTAAAGFVGGLGGVAGLLLGALAGAVAGREEWTPVGLH